jgi:CdiI N-terminal domain
MTFSIRSCETGEIGRALCEIIIGEHKEAFPLITTYWDRSVYESQWIEALAALVDGRVSSCALVTDIQPPEDSFGIVYWALFRRGDIGYVQERFSRELSAQFVGSAESIESHIPPRIQGTPEEHAAVSEWVISIGDLRQFVADTSHRKAGEK